MGKRTSKIWTIGRSELQDILDTSSTMVEVLEKLEYDGYNGNHRTIKLRIKEDDLDLTQFNSNNERYMEEARLRLKEKNKRSDGEVFCKNSTYRGNKELKKRLLKDHGWEYKCKSCDIGDTYNNQPLSLQLDHINGINSDNRMENLRLLCPNCHSQTKTFSGKKTKVTHVCEECNEEKKTKISQLCNRCSLLSRGATKLKDLHSEELYELVCVKKTSFKTIGKMFDVSDNAIRKRCRKFNIDPKQRKKI